MRTPFTLRPFQSMPRGGWIALAIFAAIAWIGIPVAHLALPESHPLHVSAYTVSLLGKILCYMVVAVAMDLIWGYAGILSLGHGLFFALGGYAFGMYLMRQIGRDGSYGADIPILHGLPRLSGVALVLGGLGLAAVGAVPGGRAARGGGLRVRLVRLPLAHQGGVFLSSPRR